MPNPVMYDAINLFKYSPSGDGTRQVGGNAAYRRRYRDLIERAIDTMWRMWGEDELGYADIGRTFGRNHGALARWGRYNIVVNESYRPDVAAYSAPENQAKLAATSLVLIHEAIHETHDADYVPEEIVCRTVQNLYYHDLLDGRNYESRVTGGPCFAQLVPNSPVVQQFLAEYDYRIRKHEWHQTVDVVVNNAAYSSHLQSDFVSQSSSWWGGLRNRWPTTRGHYLRVLAQGGSNANRQLILTILESLDAAQWQSARTTAGSVGDIRHSVRLGLYDNDFQRRARQVERRLGIDLGATNNN